VLISLLLPTLSAARGAGNATKCMANLREIGIALRMYAQEQRGYLPPGEAPPTPAWQDRPFWEPHIVATRYLRSGSETTASRVKGAASLIFKCPADPTVNFGGDVENYHHNTSYVANGLLMPRAINYPAPFRGPQKIGRFNRPSDRLLLTEKEASFSPVSRPDGYGGPFGLTPAGSWLYDITAARVAAHHGKRKVTNVLFLDGHVVGMQRADVIRPAERAKAGELPPDPTQLWGQDK
jgi:prepilin-type processing-associated H-X9-DG protein